MHLNISRRLTRASLLSLLPERSVGREGNVRMATADHDRRTIVEFASDKVHASSWGEPERAVEYHMDG